MSLFNPLTFLGRSGAIESVLDGALVVSGIRVEVVHKAIKNLRLGVYPRMAGCGVAAPLVISDEATRLAVIDKLGWIRRKRAAFENQPRQSTREMVSGESHYFLGQRYRLRVVGSAGAGRIVLRQQTMELHVRPESDIAYRQQVLAKWEPVVGVQANGWRVKKMKTKWGRCSIAAGRSWLNSELARTPLRCIEYNVVHELVHLLERQRGDRSWRSWTG